MQLPCVDQAETLRRWASQRGLAQPRASALSPHIKGRKIIAVASGKGGVGKTSVVANLALALSQHGSKILAVDGDFGFANLDILLGVSAEHSILDFLRGDLPIADIVYHLDKQVSLLPGSSGRLDLTHITYAQWAPLLEQIRQVPGYDVVLMDTPSGINRNMIAVLSAMDSVVIVITPDPASISDAYSLIKILSNHGTKDISVITNKVASSRDGEVLFGRISALVSKFLDTSIEYYGAIVFDQNMSRSACLCKPLVKHFPNAYSTQCIEVIAHRIHAQLGPYGRLATAGAGLSAGDPVLRVGSI